MFTRIPVLFLAQMYIDEAPIFEALILVNLGFIACVIYAVYHKRIIGKFVNALLDAGAVSEDNAVSLEEIGYDNNKLIKSALRRNSTLIKNILQLDGKYYIGSDTSEMMKKRYNEKDADYKNLFLTIVLLIAVFVIVWIMVPWVVERLNSVLRGLS